MAEVSVSDLNIAQQKLVESAREALDRDRAGEAAGLCARVLAEEPACLTVRKLERVAQLKLASARRSGLAKLVRAVSSAPFLLGAGMRLKDDPRASLVQAEKLLRRDPHNVAALGLLGQAALALGWPETAVFAFEGASDLEPERPDLWVSLGGAYLAAGRAPDAAVAAAEALRLHPVNAEALDLQRRATVAVSLAEGKWEQAGDYRDKLRG